MPIPSPQFIWGLIAVIAVLLILAISIIASIVVHNKKIGESENKFKLLFNKVFDALILLDEDKHIVDVNESTCNLLSYSRNDLLKLSLKDITTKETLLKLKIEFDKVIGSGIDYFGGTRLIGNGGQEVHVEVGGVCLQVDGRKFLLGSIRDITMRRQTENALKEKNIALKEILAYLEEEKIKSKQQVAKTIDHVLMPALNKLLGEDNTINMNYYLLLKNSLQELAIDTGGMMHAYSKLSPREIEICSLIKNGATSKEVARTLNISLVTVSKHRERIRKKLVISNKNINLTSYLKNI